MALPSKYDIFISYRTAHSDWVEALAHNLKAQGYSLFLDRWELIPGQDFPVKIHDALKNARCAKMAGKLRLLLTPKLTNTRKELRWRYMPNGVSRKRIPDNHAQFTKIIAK